MMHSGHRERMKARLLKSGFESFAEHELLEMLLFYSIPRRNTNDIAHSLIERFGSLRAVMSSDPDELMMTDMIGENSAALIKLAMALSKKCILEDLSPRATFNSVGKTVDFANKIFIGSTVETLYAILLDNSFAMLECCCVSTGTVNEVRPIIRSVVEKSVIKKASSVIFIHNHPNGSSKPSCEDIDMTAIAENALDLVDITLIEHIIIGNDGYSLIKAPQKSDVDKLI